MKRKAHIQYACAVLLIVSSIVLAYLSNIMHGDVPTGTLMYIAQAFLLAGSIFGLEDYINSKRDSYLNINQNSISS